MRSYPFLKTFSTLVILTVAVSCLGQSSSGSRDTEYIIERYVEQMGGRAAVQRIKSIRMSGTISYPNGRKHNITVLKKKPNLTRIVVNTGILRMVQGYDGEVAWFGRVSGKNSNYVRMQGFFEEAFIRQAPLENILFHYKNAELELEVGEDVTVALMDCYQLIARYPDGTKNIFYIEKSTFIERRILDYDAEGNLISELVPGEFESFEGVLFAKQIIRIQDGEIISTLNFDKLETNVGILDSAFSPPESLIDID